MIDTKVSIRKIAAKVSDEEIELMLAYIKGTVYGYTAEDSNKWFSVLILFGGKNSDWHNTPIQLLYDRHAENRIADAKEMAAKDVGLLLLKVLHEDKNKHYERKKKYIKSYRVKCE